MRRIEIIFFLLMIFLVSACSNNKEDINSAYKLNEEITYKNYQLTVTNFFINDLEIGLNKNDVILYIYIEYPLTESIFNNDVYLKTISGKKIDHYSVDGLDYLGGLNRQTPPFVRFSVPKKEKQVIIYINDEIRVYINLEG